MLLVQVEIWASNKIHREDRAFIGKWDVQDIISSSPQLCGPEKSNRLSEEPRHIKFHFPNPFRCRIISIKMALPIVVLVQPSLVRSLIFYHWMIAQFMNRSQPIHRIHLSMQKELLFLAVL